MALPQFAQDPTHGTPTPYSPVAKAKAKKPLAPVNPMPTTYGVVPGQVAPGHSPYGSPAGTSTPLPGGGSATPPASSATVAPGDPILQDPIYRRIVAANAQTDANAEASALTQRKQQLINYGASPELISATLGTADPNTAAAAAGNPYSILAVLAKNYADQQKNTDQTMNQGNLFFSGARVGQMGKDASTYVQNQSTASTTLGGLLTAITNALTTTRGNDSTNVTNAYTDAYTRALATATS